MTRLLTLAMLLAVTLSGLPARAEHPDGMHVHDAYARTTAKSAAIYFMVHNNTGVDDRLISATTDAAMQTMLHSQTEDANGVMQMRALEDGLPLAAGEMAELVRGGDHLMLMGLSDPLSDGDIVRLTLQFEVAGEMVIEVPVDNARKPGAGGHDHGAMGHDATATE